MPPWKHFVPPDSRDPKTKTRLTHDLMDRCLHLIVRRTRPVRGLQRQSNLVVSVLLDGTCEFNLIVRLIQPRVEGNGGRAEQGL